MTPTDRKKSPNGYLGTAFLTPNPRSNEIPMHTKRTQHFPSREEASRKLAERLARFSTTGDTIVLALPNGGVPVGAEIAELLHKPFDVLLVERILSPSCGETPLGAVTRGGVRMLNSAMIDRLNLSQSEIDSAVLQGSRKLARREQSFHRDQAPLEIADRTVILIDDGTAPCEVIRDAIRLLRRQHAERVIVALPATCHEVANDLRMEADQVVTLAEPASPGSAGKWIEEFPNTSDEDVRRLLAGKCPAAGIGN